MSEKDDDGFIGRWSRRKRSASETANEPVAPVTPDLVPETGDQKETEAETLARLGLPDPETLGPGDDFSAFMKAGVPEMLKRRALRRLWTSNPVLANIDGLVDYGENFADPALTPEVVQTAYKVGKGMLKNLLQDDAEEGDPAAPAPAPPSPEAVRPPAPKNAPQPVPDPEKVMAEAPADALTGPVGEDAEESVKEQPLRPRRMRFDVS